MTPKNEIVYKIISWLNLKPNFVMSLFDLWSKTSQVKASSLTEVSTSLRKWHW